MEYQRYCAKIEEHFLKSEYISISKDSFKMLFAPKKSSLDDMRVFCYIINGMSATDKLCRKLSAYALSAAFYDDRKKPLKTVVLPLFIQSEVDDTTLSFLKNRAFKEAGAFVLPLAFSLSQEKLLCCQSFPIIGAAQFKKISEFAKSILQP
ncbi:MAG: hypothetical protein UHH95_02745 [Oscillospiraceae bacterium]|nr:hypothetical protein [Oscillospiraceae bacterium]